MTGFHCVSVNFGVTLSKNESWHFMMCPEWESENKNSKRPKEAYKHWDLDKLDGFLTAKKNIVQQKNFIKDTITSGEQTTN